MNRLQILLQIYDQYNAIYIALILIAVWAGVAGHLIDLLSGTKLKILIPVYWVLIVLAYAAGIIFVGLQF